jgi:hypothetical protein
MSRPPVVAVLLALLACGPPDNAESEGPESESAEIQAGASSAPEKRADRMITEAVAPLPAPLRLSATVLGLRDGTLTVLREGSGPMRCLADDPSDDRWHVACYHESLEPFMERGRELRAGGAEREAVDSIRQAEIESGELPFPDHPVALYSLTGPEGAFDPETGEAPEASRLFVVYTPYATPGELGISAEPSRERPWLMYPGKPWAHVMVSGR